MKRLSFIICLVFAGLFLYGQETDITLPSGEFGGFNAQDDGVVGAIGGTVDVSAMGGGIYSIPILVPEGINGIQPNLSVYYNSQSGNGLMGWGWNLGGLSAITRTGQCMFYDDTITNVDFENDRFLLDGQRLMLVNDVPYGGDSAEYKTEIDGMNRIVSYTCDTTSGPAMFTVWLANGNIAYYGSRYDSRIGLKKHNDVCLWLLDSVVDRNGNYMSYHYFRGNIMYYLDHIEYTGNKTDDTLVSPQYKVKFIYEQGERLDKEHCFVGNYSLWQTKLLKGIKVYHLPTVTLQHQYDFDYDELGLYPNLYSYGQYSSPEQLAYYYNRLKTIVLSKGDYHYNPTRIEWGENDYKETNNRQMYVVTQNIGNDQSSYDFFNDKIKFSGDFNGDGLTDIVVYEYGTPNRARIYINQGNYRIQEQNQLHTKLRFRQLPYYFQLNDNTDWIYVADFNGDGLDDLLCLSRDRSGIFRDRIYLTGYFARLNQGEVVFDSIPTEDSYYKIKKTYAEAILVGDFLGEGKCQFYMQTYDPSKEEESSEVAYLFQYRDGEFKKTTHINNAFLYAEKFTAADFNGDGATEIIYSSEASPTCQLVKLVKKSGESGFRYHTIANFSGGVTHSHKIFLGDFNGDGHIDLLTYVPGSNGSTGSWQINLFKGDKLEYTCYSINAEDIGIGDPGNHSFTLHDRLNSDFAFIEVADMNGDGKSDIVLKRWSGGNDVLRVLYAPLRRINGETRFADIQEYSVNLNGNDNDQTACVGNFFGTETACIAFTTLAWSRSPIPNRYGVNCITDGMGNRTGFSFGYLTYNPLNSDNIYTLINPGANLGNNIYHIAIPLKAVKEIKVDNAYNNSIPIARTRYSYTNAFAHRKGRGFLGFESTISERAIGSVIKSKTVSDSEIQSMDNLCLAMPSTTRVYDKHNYLLSDTEYAYRKFKCLKDPKNKVFIIRPKKQITDNYETLGNRSFLRRRITEYSYNSDIIVFYNLYKNAVLAKTTKIGTHGTMTDSINECEYLTTTETEYHPNNISHWVLSRPKNVISTKRKLNDTIIIKEKTTYNYYSGNPFLPMDTYTYPNDENTLGTYTKHIYNKFGLVKREVTNSFIGNLQSIKSYQYSPDGRFLETESTISTDCGVYTNSYVYNPYYGNLRIAKDCNGFGAYSSNSDRMGITVYSSNLDPQENTVGGSASYSAVRWLEGSGYERFGYFLPASVYFKWKWQQGKAESLVIYDAAGRELRRVSFGLTMNDTIYVDTRYDSQGRVCETTEPYFANEGHLSVGKTAYEYDDYDRLTKTTVYDKNGEVLFVTHKDYLGLETITTTCRNNDNKEMFTDRLNIMGWKDCHIDYLNPNVPSNPANQVVVQYGYYADGKLAWAKTTSNGNINNNDTKISMEYDALGNRIRLTDPDYGTVNSYYNAFGQLCWTTTPKGDTTAYEYDGLGRIVIRTETSLNDNNRVITRWNYREDESRKGLLDNINHNSGNQLVFYKYDNLNRLVLVTDSLNSGHFDTHYQYDEFSRVKKTVYPSQYMTRNVYSDVTGILVAIKDENWHTLWKLNKLNAMGQIVDYQTGDGTVSSRSYDNMHRLETQLAMNGTTTIQDFIYEYDDFSNLTARTENKYATPITERFTYDRLNRLDSIKLNSVYSLMEYDPHGRILSKQADGQTVFSGAQYNTYDQLGNMKPHAISSATVPNGSLLTSHLESDYTTFDKVKSMTKYDSNNNVERTLAYTYGYDHQRIGMEERLGNSPYRTKTYVGNCEFNHDDACIKTFTYLSAPTGLFAVNVKEVGGYYADDISAQRLLYLHKDHLGSITTITDALGNIVQELSYDAWGNLRNPTTWSGSFTGTPLIDRGFTGHEHLYGFGLINMNGRMYDPVMSSFLSVDSYVQDPENSQNFNRYAYCFNNPLKYTDPSGEVVVIDDIVAAAIVGAIINGVVQTASGHVGNFGDWCLATVIGGAAGAAGAWAGGAAAGSLAGFYGGAVSGAVGGATGGFINGAGNTWMNGGSFGDGLASGLIGAGTSFITGGTMGGLFRGISAQNRGYNFWNGTRIDYYVYDDIPLSLSEKITDDEFLQKRVKEIFSIEVDNLGLKKITTSFISDIKKIKNPITSINEDGLFVHSDGRKVAGFGIATDWGNQELHISPYATGADAVTFQEVVGHELIHTFHNYVGLYTFNNELNNLYSERYAWSYSFMVQFTNGNFEQSGAIFAKQMELGYWGFYPPEFSIPADRKFSMSWLIKGWF